MSDIPLNRANIPLAEEHPPWLGPSRVKHPPARTPVDSGPGLNLYASGQEHCPPGQVLGHPDGDPRGALPPNRGSTARARGSWAPPRPGLPGPIRESMGPPDGTPAGPGRGWGLPAGIPGNLGRMGDFISSWGPRVGDRGSMGPGAGRFGGLPGGGGGGVCRSRPGVVGRLCVGHAKPLEAMCRSVPTLVEDKHMLTVTFRNLMCTN